MSRRVEAEKLLRQGLIPSAIARRMGISVSSVVKYLQTRVGEGALRLSQIYFFLSPDQREMLKRVAKKLTTMSVARAEFWQEHGLTLEDYMFYKPIRTRHVFAGDLYEHISETELALHDLVVSTLKQAFGEDENGYWRKGVPLKIRSECQERREADEEPAESPLQYAYLIELSQIISANWKLFQNHLPKEYRSDQMHLKKDFRRLNQIRNTVMHPIKRRVWTDNDFQFAAELRAQFQAHRASSTAF